VRKLWLKGETRIFADRRRPWLESLKQLPQDIVRVSFLYSLNSRELEELTRILQAKPFVKELFLHGRINRQLVSELLELTHIDRLTLRQRDLRDFSLL
jgi:hypothetical protein